MTAPTGRKAGRPKASTPAPPSSSTPGEVPAAPRELSLRGKKEWKRVWEAAGWLHRSQHYMLVLNYCQKVEEIGEWIEELKAIKKSNVAKGLPASIYQQNNGSWAPYPQVRLIAEGRAHLLAMLTDMRLSPSNLPDYNPDNDARIKAITKRDRSGRVATL